MTGSVMKTVFPTEPASYRQIDHTVQTDAERVPVLTCLALQVQPRKTRVLDSSRRLGQATRRRRRTPNTVTTIVTIAMAGESRAVRLIRLTSIAISVPNPNF
jgi:hypothetical protein